MNNRQKALRRIAQETEALNSVSAPLSLQASVTPEKSGVSVSRKKAVKRGIKK